MLPETEFFFVWPHLVLPYTVLTPETWTLRETDSDKHVTWRSLNSIYDPPLRVSDCGSFHIESLTVNCSNIVVGTQLNQFNWPKYF